MVCAGCGFGDACVCVRVCVCVCAVQQITEGMPRGTESVRMSMAVRVQVTAVWCAANPQYMPKHGMGIDAGIWLVERELNVGIC
jgi:hypothetical protein